MGEARDSGLFSAVVSVAAGLELGATLRRIVKAAVDLVDAEYGALGVLGADGKVVDFKRVFFVFSCSPGRLACPRAARRPPAHLSPLPFEARRPK